MNDNDIDELEKILKSKGITRKGSRFLDSNVKLFQSIQPHLQEVAFELLRVDINRAEEIFEKWVRGEAGDTDRTEFVLIDNRIKFVRRKLEAYQNSESLIKTGL